MVQIDPNKPLPYHTRLDYDECYAKIVLETFFPERFVNLRIEDKPDLRCPDRSHGIEVTNAMPREEQEALRIGAMIPYVDSEQQEQKKAYLRSRGYDYTDYGMRHPQYIEPWFGIGNPPLKETNAKWCLAAFETKVKKLNSGNYAPLKQYDLFVYSEFLVKEWMQEQLLKELQAKNNGNVKYTCVYLLALDGIYAFDLTCRSVDKKETGKMLWGLPEAARRMVEEGENE